MAASASAREAARVARVTDDAGLGQAKGESYAANLGKGGYSAAPHDTHTCLPDNGALQAAPLVGYAAGLLPWFTATAFLHSVMVQERRGMLRVWNVTLVITTFFLTIFGTFMTRSGVVQSVHAFGEDPWLARLFTGFMVLIVTFIFVLVIYRLQMIKSRHELDSWASRDAAFLDNNWVGLVIFAGLAGDLFIRSHFEFR